jgi:hypothetical protein
MFINYKHYSSQPISVHPKREYWGVNFCYVRSFNKQGQLRFLHF